MMSNEFLETDLINRIHALESFAREAAGILKEDRERLFSAFQMEQRIKGKSDLWPSIKKIDEILLKFQHLVGEK